MKDYQTSPLNLISAYKSSNGDLKILAEVTIPKEDASEEFINDVASMYESSEHVDSPILYSLLLKSDAIWIQKSIKPDWSDEQVIDYFKNYK